MADLMAVDLTPLYASLLPPRPQTRDSPDEEPPVHKANAHRSYRQKVSEHSRFFTPAELTHRRLSLAHEMVALVLSEGDALPPPMHQALESLVETLGTVMKQARGLG
jgi:hypothetical protein